MFISWEIKVGEKKDGREGGREGKGGEERRGEYREDREGAEQTSDRGQGSLKENWERPDGYVGKS